MIRSLSIRDQFCRIFSANLMLGDRRIFSRRSVGCDIDPRFLKGANGDSRGGTGYLNPVLVRWFLERVVLRSAACLRPPVSRLPGAAALVAACAPDPSRVRG